MKNNGYTIEFESTGRKKSGFTFGYIALDAESLNVAGGFDNEAGGPEDFSPEERRELADVMIAAWTRFGYPSYSDFHAASVEILRLREEKERLMNALHTTLIYGLPPNDVSGKSAWQSAKKVWLELDDARCEAQAKGGQRPAQSP